MSKQPFMKATISGGEDLAKLFDQLPKSLTDSVLKAAGKKALAPVAAAARATVQSQSNDDGDLANNIVVSTSLSKRQKRRFARRGDVAVYAGPTYPAAAHAHLIEFGTKDRQTKKGANRGRVKPEPFMRPAWDANAQKVLETMRDEVWMALKAAVRRLRKAGERGKMSKSSIKFFGG